MHTLRFSTCGSVDDGKSTLIGRLLLETNSILDDQLEAAERTSKSRGDKELDLALFTDGLRAEREQGITIDVAHRYFSARGRNFIVYDTPGHVQYTRNMVTGMSHADMALILVDARKGISIQTKRHAFISALMQVPNLVVVVNKMDLVGFSHDTFQTIVDEFEIFAKKLQIQKVSFIPISALRGDNMVQESLSMKWYSGPSILDALLVATQRKGKNIFRMSVQNVLRPNQDFRGYAGRISSGTLSQGDTLMVHPAGLTSIVREIHSIDGIVSKAEEGDSIIVMLDSDLDVSRGDVLSDPVHTPDSTLHTNATICWMSETPLSKAGNYLIQAGTHRVKCAGIELDEKIDLNDLTIDHVAELKLNDIGTCVLALTEPICIDAFGDFPKTGGFIVIDALSYNTVGAGMFRHPLPLSSNIPNAQPKVFADPNPLPQEVRERRYGHKPAVIWITGVSGAGKSSLAQLLERSLFESNCRTIWLDGDQLRKGLNRDLQFTPADRTENIRRAAEVANTAFQQGQIAICSFISPKAKDREFARSLVPAGSFIEVHLICAFEELRSRDPKGMYASALSGQLHSFTGVSAPYEIPSNPELVIDTGKFSAQEACETVIQYLARHTFFNQNASSGTAKPAQ